MILERKLDIKILLKDDMKNAATIKTAIFV